MSSLVLESKTLAKRGWMPFDLGAVFLWVALGLAITALIFTLGFGADVAQALAVME